MDVQNVTIDRKQARELYRQYKAHQHYSEPIDHEIQRAYQLIAQGRMIIKALDSIKVAGVDAQGFPKLALMRADIPKCRVEMQPNGSAVFIPATDRWSREARAQSLRIALPAGTFPRLQGYANAEGIVPICPVHLRPKRGLQNYHTLWEADWKQVPVDPMLLRRIGKADMWVVVAAWDLTEIERAALSTRLNG